MSCTSECRKPRYNTRLAHCGVCHRTFTGVSTFDDHRVGGACVMKDAVSQKNGLWGNWGTGSFRWTT